MDRDLSGNEAFFELDGDENWIDSLYELDEIEAELDVAEDEYDDLELPQQKDRVKQKRNNSVVSKDIFEIGREPSAPIVSIALLILSILIWGLVFYK